MVIVDTNIWSIALRRRPESLSPAEALQVDAFRQLTTAGEILLLGIIRQELLSGLVSRSQFERLHRALSGFQLALAEVEDHDFAAKCFNTCRENGIAAGDIDMLICAIAVRLTLPVFTNDADFLRYAKVLPIQIFTVVR